MAEGVKFDFQLSEQLFGSDEQKMLKDDVGIEHEKQKAGNLADALIDEAPQSQVDFASVTPEAANGLNVFDSMDDYNEEYNSVDYDSMQDIES